MLPRPKTQPGLQVHLPQLPWPPALPQPRGLGHSRSSCPGRGDCSPWHHHCQEHRWTRGDQQDRGDLAHHARQGNLSRPRREGCARDSCSRGLAKSGASRGGKKEPTYSRSRGAGGTEVSRNTLLGEGRVTVSKTSGVLPMRKDSASSWDQPRGRGVWNWDSPTAPPLLLFSQMPPSSQT